jgi:hypothetical protein
MEELNISRSTYDKVLHNHIPTEWAEYKINQINTEQRTSIDEMTSHYMDGRGAQVIDNIMIQLQNPTLIAELVANGKVGDVVKIYNALMSGSYKKLEIALKHTQPKEDHKSVDNFLDIMAKATEQLADEGADTNGNI